MRFVLTSVNYADFLAVTLPAWKALIPAGSLSVATSPDDVESQRVAREHGVPALVTDAWTRVDPSCHVGQGARFNMALGLDESLGLVPGLVGPPSKGEIVGHGNPDCYPFGTWPADDVFRADTVSAFWRYECLTPKHLRQHINGDLPLHRFPKLKNTGAAPIGYCHIFRYRPGLRFGSWPTAGKFDVAFTRSFPRTEMRSEVHLLHLGPINVHANWAGRVVPQWGAA